jgi:hypothetical protein
MSKETKRFIKIFGLPIAGTIGVIICSIILLDQFIPKNTAQAWVGPCVEGGSPCGGLQGGISIDCHWDNVENKCVGGCTPGCATGGNDRFCVGTAGNCSGTVSRCSSLIPYICMESHNGCDCVESGPAIGYCRRQDC